MIKLSLEFSLKRKSEKKKKKNEANFEEK